MKILHTADLHLRENDPNTVNALEEVITTAEREDIDILSIGGDLFDTPDDAESLRPQLRSLFSNNSFEIVGIPGNHDADVYDENLQFGSDIEFLVQQPFETRSYGDVEVVGVPYTSSMTEELYSNLIERSDSSKTQILLLHCTLDIGFKSSGFGNDEDEYFPVNKSVLSDLGYDYVLAGHIHSTDREVPLSNGGKFIYPGSPVSHSTKENGQRKVVLIDTSDDSVASLPLDTFYYDRFNETVRPGEEEKLIERIQQWSERHDGKNCQLSVTVDGFIEMDESEFSQRVREAADSADVTNEARLVDQVLNHPLYDRFEDRLEEREEIEEEQEVRERVIEVMSQLLSRREIQT